MSVEILVWKYPFGDCGVTVFEEGHRIFTRTNDDLAAVISGAELLREFIKMNTPNVTLTIEAEGAALNTPPRIVLELNNTIVNYPCALCGDRCDPTGHDFFLAGTWSLVCDSCAQRHAPEVFAAKRWDWHCQHPEALAAERDFYDNNDRVQATPVDADAIRANLKIVADGNSRFALLLMSGKPTSDDLAAGAPWVIYSGFATREAAEFALEDALAGLVDPTHGYPYGPSEVTVEDFEQMAHERRVCERHGITPSAFNNVKREIEAWNSADGFDPILDIPF